MQSWDSHLMLNRLSDLGPWSHALLSLLGAALIAGVISYSIVVLSEWTALVASIYGVFLMTAGPFMSSKSVIGNTIRMGVIFGLIIPAAIWLIQMR
jgi:hypothetical protein